MIGEISREGVISADPVEALAGLIDIDVPDGHEVPELWHFLYLLERPSSRDLGPDGHPRSGIPAPPRPGMRRMFAGGRIDTFRRLRIGGTARRHSHVTSEVEKQGRSGQLHFVTVRHEIEQDNRTAIVEEQDLVYREASGNNPVGALQDRTSEGFPPGREAHLALPIDERLLFRFSALTYNAHRIHYDRGWCLQEGYDDLVVHGPLQALMMGELLRRNGIALVGRRFAYELVSPMVGPQRMHVLASPEGLAAGGEVLAATGRLTARSWTFPLATLARA